MKTILYPILTSMVLFIPITGSRAKTYTADEVIQLISTQSITQLRQRTDINFSATPIDSDRIKSALWNKYRSEQISNPLRQHENQNKSISFDGHTMNYEYTQKGSAPQGGFPLYIALHGGGGTTAAVNDSQWEQMKTYYLGGISSGIYLAPRGITDTWNLHFRDPSYVMYDRIIENMILFNGVNPNKVYIMGYSAGGDGTYQLAPRMADRWAAANMSAGHPNGCSVTNLLNTPFLIQLGENDAAYNRNTEAARYDEKLNQLQNHYQTGYTHDCFIHSARPHSILDYVTGNINVMRDAVQWLHHADRTTRFIDANAIHWLDQHTRNPKPQRVVWDATTRAPSRSGLDASGTAFWDTPRRAQLFYWVDRGTNTPQTALIDVELNNNTIDVHESGDDLRLLISSDMLNTLQPIEVNIANSTSLYFSVQGNVATMSETLIDRGDPNYIFETEIVLEKRNGIWSSTEKSWSKQEKDLDHDGIEDHWETRYFGSTNSLSGAASNDSDNDGFTNLEEFITGTNPTNKMEFFKIDELRPHPPQSTILSWDSISNRVYSIYASTNLTQSWPVTPLDYIAGESRLLSFTNHPTPDALFYKIEVEIEDG